MPKDKQIFGIPTSFLFSITVFTALIAGAANIWQLPSGTGVGGEARTSADEKSSSDSPAKKDEL